MLCYCLFFMLRLYDVLSYLLFDVNSTVDLIASASIFS